MSKKNKRLNGDGSFSWIESKQKWMYKITLSGQYDENGKPVRIAVYGKTQSECRKKAQEKINYYETGTPCSAEDITITQLAKTICQDKLNDGTIQKQSYARDIETIKRLAPIGNALVSKATPLQLKNYLVSQRSYSNSIIKKLYQMLGRVFREALALEIISKNPMLSVKLPRSSQPKTDVRALTVDEQKKLVDVLLHEDIKYSEPMLLSLYTGMRMGEVLALQVCDIDFRTKVIHICKTISRDEKGNPFVNLQTKTDAGMRDLRVGEEICSFLRTCIGDKTSEEYIFTNSGNLISTNSVNTQFSSAIKKYKVLTKINGKKVTLHSLRHTYATRCIESGMQAKVLQHRLGHTDIQITYNIYGDVFEMFETDNIFKADEYFNSIGISLNAKNDEKKPNCKTA